MSASQSSDRPVVAAGGQGLAVGGELGVVEQVAVALEARGRATRPRRSRAPPRPPRPATPEAVTSRVPSGVKWTAVTLPGKSSEDAPGACRRRSRRRCRVELDRGRSGRRPATGRRARRRCAVTGRTFACEAILGTTRARRSAGSPRGPRAPASIQALSDRDLRRRSAAAPPSAAWPASRRRSTGGSSGSPRRRPPGTPGRAASLPAARRSSPARNPPRGRRRCGTRRSIS